MQVSLLNFVNASHRGCYHFMQSVWRKIRSLGLADPVILLSRTAASLDSCTLGEYLLLSTTHVCDGFSIRALRYIVMVQ